MMRAPKYLVILFVIFIATVHSGEVDICSIFDDDFILKVGKAVYPLMVAGCPIVEPSDPLHKEKIIVSSSKFCYKLYNATMKGLNQAILEFEKFYRNGTLVFNIEIPLTTIEAQYELHGRLGGMVLRGKGHCKIQYNKHKISNVGEFVIRQTPVDLKDHNHISNFTFYSDVQGESIYEYENLKNRHKELTEEELKQLDAAIHNSVITAFMQKHIENVDKYMSIVPLSEILGLVN